jgi:ferrous iron transport protein B
VKRITIALAGNPNSGKTTLFNNLTGLHHHVGNWPGKTVTVEKETGKHAYGDTEINVSDLPGTYSLSGRTLEEEIALEYLINKKPDVVVNIVDATHLERNLYLTVQLIELGVPLILALNMNRYAEKEGIRINVSALSKQLGIPVVPIEAINETGKAELINTILKRPEPSVQLIQYAQDIEYQISDTQKTFPNKTRWEAIQYLIHDNDVTSDASRTMQERFVIERYARIGEMLGASVSGTVQKQRSEQIDAIVTNKWLSFPIFLLVMYTVFQIVFTLGAPFMELIDTACGILSKYAGAAFATFDAPLWLVSLVCGGIIGGVGSVVKFLPNILLLFFLLAILEDSGYLTRVAVIMDRIMSKLGLHGRSFIPMMLGFGCSVPAIMASRTLETERERYLTILLTPFMSCGARMPVYVMLTGFFFTAAYQGVVMFSLYLLGIVVALIVGLVLQKTLFTGKPSALILEMPPYRIPTIRGVLTHAGQNGWDFLRRAGIIIFPAVLFMWLLASLPMGVEYASSESVIGVIGTAIAPVFKPLGFGTPESSIALIMGLATKEVIIGVFGTLYGAGGEPLGNVLATVFTPLSAYSFMVFVLLYMPCFAAMITIKQETDSWNLTALCAVGMIVIAWIVSCIVYQGGLLLGFG